MAGARDARGGVVGSVRRPRPDTLDRGCGVASGPGAASDARGAPPCRSRPARRLRLAAAVADRSFRCSHASEAEGEPLRGTASTITDWLLVEHPSPWGSEPLRQA